MQSTTRLFAQVFSFVLIGFANPAFADDIDIYSGNDSAGVPNVLFLFDSAANFSASAANCNYASGGAPSLNGTSGGVQQCALVDVIESLPDTGTVNIGLMAYNANNFTSGAAAGVGPCVGSNGGCLLKPLTLMNAAGKTNLVNFIKSWKSSGSTDANGFVIKTNNEATGALMQEAWAYYNGKIGMSGKDYANAISGEGCQKNFLIFIGNAFNNSGSPGDGSGAADPNNSSTGLPSAQVQATAGQKIKLSNTVKFATPTCPNILTLAASTNASDWSENWADEWARLMYEKDASNTRDGVQNIISYTIGVIDQAACKPIYPALLKNMADYGGGKYYQTGNASDVKNAILKILNEVQAVNSVFASSSLPVSVNAQGTYLNQIYMGMFRPDGTANPRWAGNLKQYSFVFDADGDLILGDAIKEPALSSSGKGFLSPNAISYWTCSNASNPFLGNLSAAQQARINACPSGTTDPLGGYWQNYPTIVTQSAGKGYDLADGEYVEKGGVSQQIRLHNMAHTAATYTAGSDTRKLYTYCPNDVGCQAALTHADNAFSVNNAGITSAMFGASTQYKVVSIVRSGNTATVTTLGNHGFASGAVVTITGATDPAYNGNKTITVPAGSATTFTFGGLNDFPTTPSTASYTVQPHALTSVLLSSLGRTSNAASASNQETALADSGSSPHGFGTGNSVTVSGATGDFNGAKNVTVTSPTTFEYPVTITPRTPSQNSYTLQRPSGDLKIVSISSGNTPLVTTEFNHGFSAGQSVVISGTGNNKYDKTVIVGAPSAKTFTFSATGNPNGYTGTTGKVTGPSQVVTVAAGNVRRTGTGTTATATVGSVTALPANVFYSGAQLLITKSGGSANDESAYAGTVVVTCPDATCTTLTYTVNVLPALTGGAGPLRAALGSGAAVAIGAGQITRNASGVATVNGIPAGLFADQQAVDILASGTALVSEAAYTASPASGWTITCTAPCTSFTFGPVSMTPISPAEGAQINVYSSSSPPDKDTLIKWVRGQDNFGDETGPGGSVTVRPSVHGDVLHSRPMVLNYGDDKGVVVYYGDNGGVFRAVNGNKVNKPGTPASWGTPGSEIWGFIPPDMYGKLNRQRLNEPDLLLPSTPAGIDPQPLKKDYFVDGPTGVFQLFNRDASNNLTTAKAVLYLTMRRGGNFLYAIDVTDPASPQVLWVKDNTSAGMGEIGQTWSLPKVALVKGRYDLDGSGNKLYRPVVVFGAGYDPAEDAEPPNNAAVSMGRGIYVLDAVSGDLVWKATFGAATGCAVAAVTANSGTASCTHADMKYSIPSDITLVDHDRDGFIDRFYFGDVGGNLWRTDLEPDSSSPLANTWRIGRLASLGCNDGVNCGAGKAPRKIFFAPEVITTQHYDAVFVITGDREHPLNDSTATQTPNRVFMVKDKKVGKDMAPTGNPLHLVIPNELTDVSYRNCVTNDQGTPDNTGDDTRTCDKTAYAGEDWGYSIDLETGEKGVNAPLVVAGSVYFGTNLPKPVNPLQCTSNLGEARGYRLTPFDGDYGYVVFDSEGLPPSPVAGVVQVEKEIVVDNNTTTILVNVPFGIGLGAGHQTAEGQTLQPGGDEPCTGADCKSAFGGGEPVINVNASRTRTYWYIENK